MPLVADYRVELEQLASQQLGRTVTIESINAEWTGMWPKIHLTEVSILSEKNSTSWMRASDVWLSLDFLSLLSTGSLDAERVKIKGMELDVVRKDEQWYVLNGEAIKLIQNNPDEQTGLVGWFFSRDRLQLADCRLSYKDERYSENNIHLIDVNLNLENDNLMHHAYGHFIVDGEQSSKLSFVLDMKGDMLRPQEVSSRFYVQGDVTVSTVMREWAKSYVDLKMGTVDLKLWGEGYIHQLREIKAEVHARDLLWAVPSSTLKKQESAVEVLNAKVFWERQEKGWNIDVEQFQLSKNGFAWPESDIHMVYHGEGERIQLEGSLDFLKLQDVSGLLSQNLPATLALSKEIKALDMQGSLRDIQFRYEQQGELPPDVYLSSTFNDLGFKRWKNLPGATGVDGSLIFTREKGYLELDSLGAVLDLGNLFKKPLQVDTLQGAVHWQLGESGLELSFDSLTANNQHVQTESRANIVIPKGKQSPFIDMVVNFKNGQIKPAALYLPQGVMSKEVASWLETSFLDGHVPSGKMVFHGRSDDFPFVNNRGTFLVDFDVEDMFLDYGELWPQLTHVNANIVFSDNSLFVKIHEGTVMKVRLSPSELTIDDLEHDSVLDLDLKFAGKTQQMLNYLHDSPVSDEARKLLLDIKTTGSMQSQLTMAIPMSRPNKFTLKGKTHFHEGDVALKTWGREFKKMKGDLSYSYDGRAFRFHSENIKGQFLGKVARINVNTDVISQYDTSTTIALESRLSLSDMLKDYLPADQGIFKGDSNWLIALTLHNNKKQLAFKSNLVGEEISLPDGFSKSVDAPRLLDITTNLDAGVGPVIHLSYGNVLNAQLQLKQVNTPGSAWKLERGTISLGKSKEAGLPVDKGLDINGELQTLAIDKWLDMFPQQKDEPSKKDPLKMFNRIKLDVGQLKLGEQQYNDFSMVATRRQSDHIVSLGAREFSGQAIIPFSYKQGAPLSIDLKYLSLTTPGEKLDASIPDPRKLPAIDLICEKLLLNGHPLGQLSMQARKVDKGLQIEKLAIQSELINIVANGSWLFKKSWHESSFNIDFATPKIGEAMKLFDFQTSIEDGKATAHLEASWSGPPHWFEMKRLNGNMKLSIAKGQLHDIEPGGGRIFGLLSVQNLRRRLTLDFSDIFKKGFGFDQIEGDFSIADGDAYTNNLFMDGPAARIDISGRIGLANEDYDEDVYVTPKLSSSLPVLGLAAGPQVAIGLFLTEKILRKNINQMSRTHYQVTGTWEQPLIQKAADTPQSSEEVVGQ